MKQLKMVDSSDFVIGYVNHEQYFIENSTEQICAFIMKFKYDDVTITDAFDQLELTTSMGFVFFCRNQTYLREELIQYLAPMQMGNSDIPEYKPFDMDTHIEDSLEDY